jgi:hypothetical protein
MSLVSWINGPTGKCLIFREAAIAGLTELSLAGSPSDCEG